MKFVSKGILIGIVLILLACSSSIFASISKLDSLLWTLEQEAPSWSSDRLAPFMLEIGIAYLENGEPEKAKDQLLRGYGVAQNLDNRELSLLFLFQLGNVAYVQHNFTKATQYYSQFLKNSGSAINSTDKASVYEKMSNIYLSYGKYEQSYKIITDALLIYENLRDSASMVRAKVVIGDIHFIQENPQLALKEYLSCKSIAESINDDFSLHSVYCSISKASKAINRKDQALVYNKKALAIAERHDEQELIAIGNKNIAQLYMELGLLELAADNFLKALEVETRLNKLSEKVSTLYGIGMTYIKMQEPEESLHYLDEAQCLANRLKLPRELSSIYNGLAEANEKLGDREAGYFFLKTYIAIKDTIFTEVALKEMGEVKNVYELESRENQIALLSAEKNLLSKEQKIKGLYWFLLFAFATFFTITSFVLISKSKMQTRLVNLLEQKSQKIKVQNGKLAQSNLDLQEFASVASHDLREPLRMIHTYTKLLNKKYSSSFDASAKEFMHFITDASTRMDRMLIDLLDYSKAQNKGERAQWVSSAELVEIALDNLKFKIEKRKVKINFQKSNLPRLYCNKTAMIQLFQNLIGNAVKFTNEQNPEVVINCIKRGGRYCFSVHDNGIGIKKENQTKIFEMFQRLHSQTEFEGTGIGLATCKKIVERHKGDIWVESKEGRGSTFFFTIPQDVQAN